jgi:hypothetical protein
MNSIRWPNDSDRRYVDRLPIGDPVGGTCWQRPDPTWQNDPARPAMRVIREPMLFKSSSSIDPITDFWLNRFRLGREIKIGNL